MLAIGLVTSGLLGPAAASKPTKPHQVALRIASVNQTTRLVAPGLAMSRSSRTLMPGGSLTFFSEPLNRPVSIAGRPWLRLHLSHTVPGDITLYVGIEGIGVGGETRTLLPTQALRAPESLLSKGPEADIDLIMSRLTASLSKSERLQVVISELGSPTDAVHPDVITVYLGALPNEDTDEHDVGQVLDRSKGGKDPARLTLLVPGEGPFQPW